MRIAPWQLDTVGAAAGDGLVLDPATDEYGPGPVVQGLTSADASVTITPSGDGVFDLASAGGGGSLTVQDENGNVGTGVTQIDFQGAGVTAAAGTGEVVVTIPGGGGGASYVGCGAERTTAQSISNAGATFTALQFNATDLWDTDSIHDPATNNTRFTIPAGKGGRWRFEASARFAPNANGQRALQFIKNGTLLSGRYGGQYLNAVGGGLASDFTGATTLNLAAGDYVEVGVYQTSGGALNVDEAFAACQFLG